MSFLFPVIKKSAATLIPGPCPAPPTTTSQCCDNVTSDAEGGRFTGVVVDSPTPPSAWDSSRAFFNASAWLCAVSKGAEIQRRWGGGGGLTTFGGAAASHAPHPPLLENARQSARGLRGAVPLDTQVPARLRVRVHRAREHKGALTFSFKSMFSCISSTWAIRAVRS